MKIAITNFDFHGLSWPTIEPTAATIGRSLIHKALPRFTRFRIGK
jgi:hypothetical protein